MTILEQEIQEQPKIVARLLEQETEPIRRLIAELRGRFHYLLLAARGTSDNAARYAQYLFGAQNRLQAALATPSLFTLYHKPPDLSGALVIGISQSGQSPDIVTVIKEGRRQGRPTLALTNDPESPLAEAAQYIIPLRAGPEQAVAATKTYTASLTALALFSALLAEDSERLAQLQRIPDRITHTLVELASTLDRVERYRYMSHCVVIGRGYNYATAFEIALKIKELTRVVAEPYSPADFRHGPIAMVEAGFPVMLIAPGGAVRPDIEKLLAELRPLAAERLVISETTELLEQAHLAFALPAGLPEWLSPLITVLPGQLFGLRLAECKGLDPDQPVGLQKVTETL